MLMSVRRDSLETVLRHMAAVTAVTAEAKTRLIPYRLLVVVQCPQVLVLSTAAEVRAAAAVEVAAAERLLKAALAEAQARWAELET